MYSVLVADDNFEDRELLKMEIERALRDMNPEIRFYEAPSVKQALELLKSQPFDLLTLDIQFDRLSEGIEALPEIFEKYPTLNILVISGKLNKTEVAEQMFRFTKDNVLKVKRWVRHFDVLDKKDDKTDAVRRAYSFAFGQADMFDKVRDLFLAAESHLERNEVEKCREIYGKIQELVPGEQESGENLRVLGRGFEAYEQALDYLRRGDTLVASLLLGHHLENRLKAFTRRLLGRANPGLYDCVKELERARRISPYKKSLFHQIIKFRNKAIHKPSVITEQDFENARQALKLLEANF